MRCSVSRRYRGKDRPCIHPAIVVVTAEPGPYPFCKGHWEEQGREAFAAKRGYQVRGVLAGARR